MKIHNMILAGLAALSLTTFSQVSVAREKCTIAFSHYTGWEPLPLAKHLGILKKWGDKYNVDLDVTAPMDYVESYTQFGAGQFCGVVVTNMDALDSPAAGGRDTSFVVLGDYSNGNDGIAAKSIKPLTVKDLPGKEVTLIEETVSHYLLWRAAQIHKFDFKAVKVKNANSETEVKGAFGDGSYIITWHPNLITALNEKNAQLLFSSAAIPGEIIDGIAVNNDKGSSNYASDNARKALAGAWFEVIALIGKVGSPEQKAAIEWMAGFSSTEEQKISIGQFNAQLGTTALFYTPKDAVAFTMNPQLRATMERVRTFAAELGILKNNSGVPQKSDFVGIQFPDGTTMGDKNNVKLRFDTTYMDLAAAGKL